MEEILDLVGVRGRQNFERNKDKRRNYKAKGEPNYTIKPTLWFGYRATDKKYKLERKLRTDFFDLAPKELEEKIEELREDKRSEVKEEVLAKYEKFKKSLERLYATDIKTIKAEEARQAQKREQAMLEYIKENKANMNQFERIEGGIGGPYGLFSLYSDDEGFVERIFNATYYMVIGLKIDFTYLSRQPFYKTKYKIHSGKKLENETLKDVENRFSFDPDDPEAKQKAKEEALEYIEGRKKHWTKKLFQDIQPALPKGKLNLAKINGILCGGYEEDCQLSI